MTGEEYRQFRDMLGYTRLQLANALNIDPSTVARREKSETIDTEAEIAIRSLHCEEEPSPTGGG